MIILFNDFKNLLPVVIDTENVFYITCDENLNRAIAYTSEGLITFNQRLSTLLLQFVNNDLVNYVYFIEMSGLNYLVNIDLVKHCFLNNEETKTYIMFDDLKTIKLDHTYPHYTIKKVMDIRNESKDSREIHTSSESNS